MSRDSYNGDNRKSRVNVWLVLGAIILIILLILWLTVAEFTGDTDVAAYIPGTGAAALWA